MSDHIFRNPDKFQVLPVRDFIREVMPNAKEGYVVEDLDMVIRIYGEKFGVDDIGRFMLVEQKWIPTWLTGGQENTFGLIHRLLRMADPRRERYWGYFVLRMNNDNPRNASLIDLNRCPITPDELLRWLAFENIGVPSLWDGVPIGKKV